MTVSRINVIIFIVNQLNYKGAVFMSVTDSFIDSFFRESFSYSEKFFDDIYDGELAKAFAPFLPEDTKDYSGITEKLSEHISESCPDPSDLLRDLSELSEAAQKNKSLAFKCGIKAGLRFAHEIASINKLKSDDVYKNFFF